MILFRLYIERQLFYNCSIKTEQGERTMVIMVRKTGKKSETLCHGANECPECGGKLANHDTKVGDITAISDEKVRELGEAMHELTHKEIEAQERARLASAQAALTRRVPG